MNESRKLKLPGIDPSEYNISIYKNFYERNQKVKRPNLFQLIKAIDAIDVKATYYSRLAELKRISTQVKELITDRKTISEFESVTRQTIQKKKEEAFDIKNPPVVSVEGTKKEDMSILMESFRLFRRTKDCAVTDEQAWLQIYLHKSAYLKQLYNCLVRHGLRYDLIQDRPEDKILYNLYICHTNSKGKDSKDALILLKREDLLEHYIEPYNAGYPIMFDGVTIKPETVKVIRVSCAKYQKDG